MKTWKRDIAYRRRVASKLAAHGLRSERRPCDTGRPCDCKPGDQMCGKRRVSAASLPAKKRRQNAKAQAGKPIGGYEPASTRRHRHNQKKAGS